MLKCPNGLTPRTNADGHALQCVPGAWSSEICGDGHSCWFNGFNYLCCPTQTVETSTSKPVQPTHKKGLISKMIITKSSTPSLCPFPAAAMRNENFEIVECDRDRKCPVNGFCSSLHQRFICCQQHDGDEPSMGGPAVRVSADSFPMSFQPLPVAHIIGESASPNESIIEADTAPDDTTESTTTEPTTTEPTTTEPSTTDAPTTTDTVLTTSSTQPPLELSTSEEVTTTTDEPTTTLPPLSFASKVDSDDIFRYRPHSAGGYVLEKQVRVDQSKEIRRSPASPVVDQRLIAQDYLLEQIRNGWPYHERYYRTDVGNDVQYAAEAPFAIVHFPKQSMRMNRRR